MNAPGPIRDIELDIGSIRAFLAVAEELNFTRAAARLFVAQQALSREIQQLERRLGTTLFVRSTRRVALSPDGQRLLRSARELVALHDQIVDELVTPRRPFLVDLLSEGRLTGARILEAARAAAPDLEFRGRYGGGVGLALRLLLAGELDVAIGRTEWVGQERHVRLERRSLRFEPLGLLLPLDHELANRAAISLGDVRGRELDTNPATSEALEWIDLVRQFLEITGAVPTPPHVPAVGIDDQAHHLIRQGLPILTSVDHVPVPGGVIRPLVDPVPVYPWSVVWRVGAPRAGVQAIESAIDVLTATGDWLTLPDEAWLPEPEAARAFG